MDFTKSVMLTSDEYVTAALEVRRTRLALAAKKEQNRKNKEEPRRRKLEERKEANRLRGIRAQEVAEAKAKKLPEQEEAQRQKAAHLAMGHLGISVKIPVKL